MLSASLSRASPSVETSALCLTQSCNTNIMRRFAGILMIAAGINQRIFTFSGTRIPQITVFVRFLPFPNISSRFFIIYSYHPLIFAASLTPVNNAFILVDFYIVMRQKLLKLYSEKTALASFRFDYLSLPIFSLSCSPAP